MAYEWLLTGEDPPPLPEDADDGPIAREWAAFRARNQPSESAKELFERIGRGNPLNVAASAVGRDVSLLMDPETSDTGKRLFEYSTGEPWRDQLGLTSDEIADPYGAAQTKKRQSSTYQNTKRGLGDVFRGLAQVGADAAVGTAKTAMGITKPGDAARSVGRFAKGVGESMVAGGIRAVSDPRTIVLESPEQLALAALPAAAGKFMKGGGSHAARRLATSSRLAGSVGQAKSFRAAAMGAGDAAARARVAKAAQAGGDFEAVAGAAAVGSQPYVLRAVGMMSEGKYSGPETARVLERLLADDAGVRAKAAAEVTQKAVQDRALAAYLDTPAARLPYDLVPAGRRSPFLPQSGRAENLAAFRSPSRRGLWIEMPDEGRWGPLRGMVVRLEDARALELALDQVGSGWSRAMASVKKGKVIANPAAHFNAWVGNGLMQMMDGGSPLDVVRGLRDLSRWRAKKPLSAWDARLTGEYIDGMGAAADAVEMALRWDPDDMVRAAAKAASVENVAPRFRARVLAPDIGPGERFLRGLEWAVEPGELFRGAFSRAWSAQDHANRLAFFRRAAKRKADEIGLDTNGASQKQLDDFFREHRREALAHSLRFGLDYRDLPVAAAALQRYGLWTFAAYPVKATWMAGEVAGRNPALSQAVQSFSEKAAERDRDSGMERAIRPDHLAAAVRAGDSDYVVPTRGFSPLVALGITDTPDVGRNILMDAVLEAKSGETRYGRLIWTEFDSPTEVVMKSAAHIVLSMGPGWMRSVMTPAIAHGTPAENATAYVRALGPGIYRMAADEQLNRELRRLEKARVRFLKAGQWSDSEGRAASDNYRDSYEKATKRIREIWGAGR